MRTPGAIVTFFALSTLAPPSPAVAQYGQYGAPASPPPVERGNRDQAQPTAASPAEVHRAAACLVSRDAESGAELLATALQSREERRLAVDTLRSAQRCLRSRVAIATSPMMWRGAVAEALYENRFATPPSARSPAAAVPARAATASEGATVSFASAFALADCSAGARPDVIRTLLASEPGSPEERAAFQSLNPVFSGCVTAGTTINADRATFRGLLAESLYRWSLAQTAVAPPPAANPAR